MTKITMRWRARDGYTERRTYKTLDGARRFAEKWVGATPEVGIGYATDRYGIGRVTWEGCTAAELFPCAESEADLAREEAEFTMDYADPEDYAAMAEEPEPERRCPECGGVETLDPLGGMSCELGCRYG